MAFLSELATNTTKHGIKVIIYSGNDDLLVAHRSSEGTCCSFRVSEYTDNVNAVIIQVGNLLVANKCSLKLKTSEEHDFWWDPRVYQEAFYRFQ